MQNQSDPELLLHMQVAISLKHTHAYLHIGFFLCLRNGFQSEVNLKYEDYTITKGQEEK